jgi:hypothetical protein
MLFEDAIDDLVVNLVVLVGEDVAQSGNANPADVRGEGLGFFAEFARSLTNEDEVVAKRVPEVEIVRVVSARWSAQVAPANADDAIRTVQNVSKQPDVRPTVSLGTHTGTASLRACSSTSGRATRVLRTST